MRARYLIALLIISILGILYVFYEPAKSLAELKEKYTNEHSSFVQVGKQLVHYQKYGSQGPVLLLLHGTGASLHTWEAWASELQDNYQVYTIDLPGYGLTGPSVSGKYDGVSYARFINDFLTYQKIDSCIIAGNSLGGFIAWNTAIDYPEKIKAMILVDPAGFKLNSKSVPIAFRLARVPVLNQLLTFITPRTVIEKSVKNVYFDPSLVTEELVERYFDLTLRKGNREAFVKRMQNEEFTSRVDELNKIEIPTLILWGEQDQLIPVENAAKFSSALKNDTLVVMPNLGHVAMEEAPEESLKPVLTFLKSIWNAKE